MQWASFSDVRPLKIRKISSCILFDLALVFIFLRVEPATMTTNFPSPSGITALLVPVTVSQGLAFISTVLRLWLRCHIRWIWWGNVWAALSLCFDMTCLTGMWTLTAPLARPDDPKSTGAINISRRSHVASHSLLITSYTRTIWCARLGIVCSVIHIVGDSRRTHSPCGALARASFSPSSTVSSLVAITTLWHSRG
ncbi:hypothetical protein BV22DRAFT_887896 [Leucogyrophana mollusca]|uniref:Uncharacterized protein n=1 Tax=Leucogyrophana mollusca TaxID=85980 RepID=A0ACB8AZV2_9AGAM|nr:hypothetical protein BV22DRAFT_887896 [Leucogyrophana mollusca]